MSFNIIHIVSSLEKVNFGIWNAAITGAVFLKEHHNVESQVWVCDEQKRKEFPFDLPIQWLGKNSTYGLRERVASERIITDNSIVVSHGCWLKPTRVGYELKKMGFNWVYVPHGMLEPWSMRQGRIKKQLYYRLIEKRLARNANAFRAVSKIELENLTRKFHRKVSLIENGVNVPIYPEKPEGPETFLFMARLHYKKGILPLVKAWRNCMSHANKKLIIAGPDEGELQKISPYLNGNIEYIGAVYGNAKTDLLNKAHYFLLPSYSEGFPTSVVEAMSFGLIPLISKGCNFPEVFSNNLGYNIEPDKMSLEKSLTEMAGMKFNASLSRLNHQFIQNHFSTSSIGSKLFFLYSDLMALKSKT